MRSSSPWFKLVAGNMEGYSARQIKDSKRALELCKILGYPSRQDYINMIRGGKMSNCDLTEDDVKRMYNIWGEDFAVVKGKTTRKTPDRIRWSVLALSPELLEKL